MVCHSVEVQQCSSPFLIVCPASVLSNWASELQHWAPDLAVVQYRGSADARENIYKKQVGGRRSLLLLCDDSGGGCRSCWGRKQCVCNVTLQPVRDCCCPKFDHLQPDSQTASTIVWCLFAA
eukprot:GHRQ01019070.1.p2 GENE.GHRQ01019070.1~~GHRQ01019070.1.p2  ORF type:complete len:122 (-),score=30.84 GHRQ01019070.1:883-1248(-)